MDHTRLISATRSFISAVIVGATSEIGQAYAEEVCIVESNNAVYYIHFLFFQLARRNMNVVLISKSYDDLVLLVAKIRECLGIFTYYVSKAIGFKFYLRVICIFSVILYIFMGRTI